MWIGVASEIFYIVLVGGEWGEGGLRGCESEPVNFIWKGVSNGILIGFSSVCS